MCPTRTQSLNRAKRQKHRHTHTQRKPARTQNQDFNTKTQSNESKTTQNPNTSKTKLKKSSTHHQNQKPKFKYTSQESNKKTKKKEIPQKKPTQNQHVCIFIHLKNNSCEVEDLVGTHLCTLCDTSITRACYGWIWPRVGNTVRIRMRKNKT